MRWHVLPVPPSAKLMLSKTGVTGFSKVQVLTAVLDWFARLPPAVRATLTHQYALELAKRQTTPAAAGASVRAAG